MKPKWLLVLVVLLFLLSWTSVFAGPKGEVGHGDDDIPELTRPRSSVSVEKLLDSLDAESLWNAVFRADEGKQLEHGIQRDARSVDVPAARRYPVRLK
jgi:hypothetical protein